MSSNSKYLQLMYNNMGPKTTPSLISRGGGVSGTPPLAWDEIDTPGEKGLKDMTMVKNKVFSLIYNLNYSEI